MCKKDKTNGSKVSGRRMILSIEIVETNWIMYVKKSNMFLLKE
jgi:hypothetical protein